MEEVDNFPNLMQLQFRNELIEALISDLLSRQHDFAVDGPVQAHHWPVKMSKGRCERCLRNRKNTFCRMDCELCGVQVCLACFKNHHLASL